MFNLFFLLKVRDILEKQLKKRPNRESLVQKNILPGKFFNYVTFKFYVIIQL
jgi:hypothetical protein